MIASLGAQLKRSRMLFLESKHPTVHCPLLLQKHGPEGSQRSKLERYADMSKSRLRFGGC